MATIDKIPSGRFRVRWRGHDNRQQSKSFVLKADADAFRRQIERELDAGLSITSADRRLTVSDYVHRGWLESRPWRELSRDKFDSQWRAHIGPRWADVRLTTIARTDVQGWINDLEKSGLAANTIRALHTAFASILRAAHDDGVIPRQPATRIVLPKTAPAEKVKVPTLEQVHEIAGAVPARYEALVWTCALGGLRPSEAIGLTVDRVDFLRGTATIDRQLTTFTGGPRFAPLKTKALPKREIPVAQELVERLAAHLEQWPAIEAGDDLGGTGKLIFTNNIGSPIQRTGYGSVWRRMAKRIDLPAEIDGFHALRHFAITRLIVAGVNPDYVRQFAGHTSLTDTLNTYSGWWPSDADNARDALTEALGGFTTGSPALRSVLR